jgi:geranylgeranyl diphosphate synthase type II
MFDLSNYMAAAQARVEAALEAALPRDDVRPAELHRAMRYCVLSNGKRLRPILCLAAAQAAGGNSETALPPAVAVELLHTYTLVHDDLPAMDDDAERRGRPSCHVAFGEATAILVGDALQALAFETLAAYPAPPPYPPVQLVRELAAAAGSLGVVGGQVEDIAGAGRAPDEAMIDFIHRHKTADLFRAAIRMGAISAGATEADLESLTRYAVALGLAFQVVDDVLDASYGEMQPDGFSCIEVYGMEGARGRASELTAEASEALRDVAGNTEPLAALAEQMLKRIA